MPTPALMVDSNRPAQELIGHLGLTGCVAIARPLYAGATSGVDGPVPEPVATPLDASELAVIRQAGLAAMPYLNSIGWGDLADPALCAAKVRAGIAKALALGFPAGTYLGIDLEGWTVPGATVSAVCAENRASVMGGAGLLYLGAIDPTIATWRQLRATDDNVARALLWVARYPAPWSGVVPVWDPGVDDPAVAGWQFASTPTFDLTILRLPLLTIGNAAEGFLLPDGSVGSPQTPDVIDALAAADQIQSGLAALRTALSR